MTAYFLSLLLFHLGLLGPCLARDGKKCYYTDGSEATYDYPCDPDAEVSVCCADAPIGYACLSNKLCLGPSGKVIRGSCTQQDWSSPDCPNFCTNWAPGGHDLVSCSNVTGRDTSYCCDEMPNCCDGGVGRFELYPSNPFTWARWVSSSTRYVVQTPLTTTTSSSTATATTSDPTPTSSADDSQNAGETAAGATKSSGTPGPTASSSQQTTDSAGLSTGAKAGIGVGAAGVAVLIAAVAFLWWKLNQTKKLAAEQAWPGAYAVQPGAPSYYPQDPRAKVELPVSQDLQELEGVSNAELAGYPAYSPVAHPRSAQ